MLLAGVALRHLPGSRHSLVGVEVMVTAACFILSMLPNFSSRQFSAFCTCYARRFSASVTLLSCVSIYRSKRTSLYIQCWELILYNEFTKHCIASLQNILLWVYKTLYCGFTKHFIAGLQNIVLRVYLILSWDLIQYWELIKCWDLILDIIR